VFVLLYDAFQRGGLYLRGTNAHMLDGAELAEALAVHNALRAKDGKDELPLSYYMGSSPQRMWSARIEQYWVNGTERDSQGHIVRDLRTEVRRTDLVI
jgi:hypothetical protein